MPSDEPSTKTAKASNSDAASAGAVVVDLGKRKRKQVRRLRKGRGKLLDEVNRTIEELQKTGAVNGDAVPIVFVVRQRKRSRQRWCY